MPIMIFRFLFTTFWSCELALNFENLPCLLSENTIEFSMTFDKFLISLLSNDCKALKFLLILAIDSAPPAASDSLNNKVFFRLFSC